MKKAAVKSKTTAKGAAPAEKTKKTTGRTASPQDPLSTLRRLNSSLQKSYNSTHSSPFIPSSATMKSPTSPSSPLTARHKYWRLDHEREKEREAHTQQREREGGNAYDAFFDDESPSHTHSQAQSQAHSQSNKAKNFKSEYDAKYVEWELPAHSPEREREREMARRTSFSPYDTQAAALHWRSEQRDAFHAHDVSPAREREREKEAAVAGVVTKNKNQYSTDFNWRVVDQDKTHEEGDEQDRGLEGKLRKNSRANELNASEHDRAFQWPAPAERVIYTNPHKQLSAPIPRDPSPALAASQWRSEYDDANTELRRRETERATHRETEREPAGLANVRPKTENPKFYAWEEAEQGESERERVTSTEPSLLSHTQERDRFGLETGLSQDDHASRSAGVKSEYTRTYHWPAANAYTHTQRANGRRESDAEIRAVLSHAKRGTERDSEGLESEYQHEFVEKHAKPPARVRGASTSEEVAPPFAVVDEGVLAREEERERLRGIGPGEQMRTQRPHTHTDSLLSEHTAKYRWHEVERDARTGTDAHREREKEREKESTMWATDGVRAGDWVSEYDAQCQSLREKQRHLLGGDKAAFVAGLPSAKRPAVPANFAWTEGPEPRKVAPKATPSDIIYHVDAAHFKSENKDKFVPWKVDREKERERELATREKVETDHLKDVLGDKDSRDISKSEYRAQFTPLSGSTENIRFISRERESAPPQFAWTLDERAQENDKAERAREIARKKGMLRVADEPLGSSEYAQSFPWPAPDERTQAVPPPRTHIEQVLRTDARNDWESEYDAHAKDALRSTSTVEPPLPPPAGTSSGGQSDTPVFFAWTPPPAPPHAPSLPAPPRFPAEVVPSEHRSQFIWRESEKEPSKEVRRSARESETGKWFAHEDLVAQNIAAESESSRALGNTEYRENFQWSAGGGPQSAVTQRAEVLPAQFAWSLVDGARTEKPRPRSAPPRTSSAVSESKAAFQWRPEHYLAAHPSSEQRAHAARTHNVDHVATVLNDLSSRSQGVDWCSEYDDRCAALRERQRSLCDVSGASQTQTRAESGAAPFFVWSEGDTRTPLQTERDAVLREKPQIPTETSEYRERFVGAPTNRELARPVDRTSLTLSHGKFNAQSEYATQFSHTSPHDASKSTHHVRRAERESVRSLPQTVLDLYSYTPQTPRAHTPQRTSQPSLFSTEQRDKFLWPAERQTYTQPPTHTHTHSTLATHRALSATLSPTLDRRLAATHTLPLTETQQSFAWPVDVSHTTHNAHTTREQKIHRARERREKMRNSFPPGSLSSATAASSAVRKYSVMSQPPSRSVYRDSRERVRETERERRPATSALASERARSVVRTSSQPERKTQPQNTQTQPMTGTVMSADSLSPPEPPRSTQQQAHTPEREKESAPRSPVSVAEPFDRPSSSMMKERDLGREELFHRDMSPVRGGFRDSSSSSFSRVLNRSAPPRQVISRSQSGPIDSAKFRMYRDETASNPVLMYRRYPAVSDKQTSRWSTETGDNFRWRAARSPSP